MRKEKITISVDPGLLKWVDSQVQTKRFASRSHAIGLALSELRKKG